MMCDSGSDEEISAEDGGSTESGRKVTLGGLSEFWLHEHSFITYCLTLKPATQ